MKQTRMKLILLGVALATLGVYVIAFFLSTTEDRVDQLDTTEVKAAATAACVELRTEIDAQRPLATDASDAERQARVDEQARSVQQLVSTVEAVGAKRLDADSPAREWLADWQTLVRIRQDYAAAGFTGTFALPVDNGQPISERMNRIGVDACSVPIGLTTAP